jgi:hypothetical protein
MSDPLIKRGQVRTVIGVEVDTLDVELMCNSETTFNNQPLQAFAMRGGFDGMRLSVDRFFAENWDTPPAGAIRLFTGRVSEVNIESNRVLLTVKSDLELLNVKLPRNVYQVQCVHTVYHDGCQLNAEDFTVSRPR